MLTNKENLFDKRVVEKNMAAGDITRVEYEEYLENLPDVSDKVADNPDDTLIDEDDLSSVEDETISTPESNGSQKEGAQ